MAITELMARSEISSLLPSMEVKQLRADATSRNTATSSVRAINTSGSKMPYVCAWCVWCACNNKKGQKHE